MASNAKKIQPWLLLRVWMFLKDGNIGWGYKIAVVCAFAYAITPFDFDWIPILGWLDDIGVVAAVAALTIRAANRYIDEKQLVEAAAAKQIEAK